MADQKAGRLFIGGTLYDFCGHSYTNYQHLAVCANCDQTLRTHVGEEDKCLFESTIFRFVYDYSYVLDNMRQQDHELTDNGE